MTNITGNISSQTWTLANNDYHITGITTILQDQTVTVQAGVNIYYDGNYDIRRQAGTSPSSTTFNATGTPTLPITIEHNSRRTGTAIYNNLSLMFLGANNSTLILKYCKVSNTASVLTTTSTTGNTITIDNCVFMDLGVVVVNSGNTVAPAITFNNCIFESQKIAGLQLGAATTMTIEHNFNNCSFYNCAQIATGTVSSGMITIKQTDCYFSDKTIMSPASGNLLATMTHTFIRCYIDGQFLSTSVSPLNFTSSIISKLGGTSSFINIPVAGTTTVNLTNSDIGLINYSQSAYAINNASTGGAVVNANGCFLSGMRNADIYCYYNEATGNTTPAQVVKTGTINFTNERTSRNFPFMPTSISASSFGTIITTTFTVDFRTRTRVLIGTTSGTYTSSVETIGTWDNADGVGQWTTSPSLVFTGVSGTTYYILPQAWDLVTNKWNSGAEQTVAVSGLPVPVFAGLTGLETKGFGSLLCTWADATGTVSTYNIYARIGSAPTATDAYLVGKFDNGLNEKTFNYLRDDERIQDDQEIFVMAKAENSSGLDTNTVVYSLNPQGSGTVGVRTVNGIMVGLKGK